ncbi:purine-nucleoside phosphorylase [Candidatus Woesearchaeota archaeon]|nr:purine-nucleoside phosphorylase [Candidatus Woesearchaeota archaeon]
MTDSHQIDLERIVEFHAHYESRVKHAAETIRQKIGALKPVFGVVLGSGLGQLAQKITNPVKIPYADIPGFPTTTVPGHEGILWAGHLEGVPVIGLQGRKHYYEVADLPCNAGMLHVTFPVHVLAELGVTHYFATNAAGGLNQRYEVGGIMVINSHIGLYFPNALLGRQHDFRQVDGKPCPRFQPMNDCYDPELTELLFNEFMSLEIEREAAVWRATMPRVFCPAGEQSYCKIYLGVYAAVTGPTYETSGESLALMKLGADAVGMSTVPEVIVARNRGMKCVALSCITNKIAEDGTNATTHAEVQAILNSDEAKNRLTGVIGSFFRAYGRKYLKN